MKTNKKTSYQIGVEMVSEEQKSKELKNILRRLQSMEMRSQYGVMNMRTPNNTQNPPARLYGYNLPSLPPDQLKYTSETKKKGPNLSTILFVVTLSATLSTSVISYILYKDSWFPEKQKPTQQITLVKPSPVVITDHRTRTDNFLRNIKKRAVDKIKTANELLSKGNVLAARHILVELTRNEARLSKSIYIKVAVSLAKTYDASVLKNLPRPDAHPDSEEAEYWYRQWYTLSAEQSPQ